MESVRRLVSNLFQGRGSASWQVICSNKYSPPKKYKYPKNGKKIMIHSCPIHDTRRSRVSGKNGPRHQMQTHGQVTDDVPRSIRRNIRNCKQLYRQ